MSIPQSPTRATGLDALFGHYIEEVMRNMEVSDFPHNVWTARLDAPKEFEATGFTREEAVDDLAGQVKRWVFSCYTTGQTIPIVNGININPGSC